MHERKQITLREQVGTCQSTEVAERCDKCGSHEIVPGVAIQNFRGRKTVIGQPLVEGQWFCCAHCGYRWFAVDEPAVTSGEPLRPVAR